MRTWAGRRPRLPPEPWLTSTAAPLRDGTYQAESLRPSSMAIRTSWWGIPRADSWISQRGACVIRLAPTNGITPTNGDERGAGEPARAMRGAPAETGPPGRASRRRDGGEAGRDEQGPAEGVADSADVARVEPGVDDVQPVRDPAEADGQQPDDDAQPEPRRPRHARLGERPGQRQGHDGEHAEHGGVGAREREVEQVGGDEREPREQQRALEARDPLAEAAARRRGGGGAGLGGARLERDRGHARTVPGRRPAATVEPGVRRGSHTPLPRCGIPHVD